MDSEALSNIARQILEYALDTLRLSLRFMDRALHRLQAQEVIGESFAIKGEYLCYGPRWVIQNYRQDTSYVALAYLHAILHCVFLHMFVGSAIDVPLWNLACDIAVESVILEMNIPSLKSDSSTKEQRLQFLKGSVKSLTAEHIYAWLRNAMLSERQLKEWQDIFTVDDHRYWYPEDHDDDEDDQDSQDDQEAQGDSGDGQGQSSASSGNDQSEDGQDQGSSANQPSKESFGQQATGESLKETWESIAEMMLTDLQTFSQQQGSQAGDLVQNLQDVTRERYSYTEFLRKFATRQEIMKLDMDEFDYVFYTYGLNLYGNVPLIEPLEYREDKRIRELVIAIDTSGSVSGRLVNGFMRKTFNILKNEESFARRFVLYIIQCDATIQEAARIETQEEFDQYLQDMTLKGFGGTDFRPVFDYVDSLIGEKQLRNLKGLIYFTDGYGTFPSQKPSYETAFVFLEDEDVNVPPWAIKLILDEHEFE